MNLKPILLAGSFAAISISILAHAEEKPENITIPEKDEKSLDADSISLPDEFTELEELVVVERQKLVKSDGAILTYNVADDPEAANSNTLDILRKVPGIIVDAEDNIKVNGQSSFKVLLNGREDALLKGDLKTILKSFPAGTIKRIEVISEPGAKYDAEGVGGILNIVTDKSTRLQGFLTQLGAWLNAYQAGGYVSARKQMGKVMLDARISYNNGRVWPRENRSERIVEALDGSENHLFTTKQKMKSGWDYTGINLNMSWEPDTLNLFNFSANYGYNSWGNKGEESRSMQRPDLSTLWNLQRDIDSDGKYNGLGLQAAYQHNFRREDHNIVLSYLFNFANQDYDTKYLLNSVEGTVAETPYSLTRNHGKSYYNVIQLDYSNRFSPRHLLEAGGKAFINSNNSYNSPFFGISSEDMVENKVLAVDMTQIKDVYAAYASYTGSFSKWSVKGGLRYEHTLLGSRYRIGDYTDFNSRLNDIVPNAAVSYNFTDASSIRAAYQMRISRPDISQVNPYVSVLNPGQIQYGDPHLRSERAHTFSLDYGNYSGAFGGNAKLTYRYTDNGVCDIIFMRDGVMNSTYANVGLEHLVCLDINADWSITNNLKWGLYLSGSYDYMKADSELLKAKNHGWQYNASTNLSYTLRSGWRMSVNGGFWTPWRDLQSHGETIGYYYSLGVGKSWLKDDALTVNASISSILPTHKTNRYIQQDESVRLSYKSRYASWNAGVSITYKFGGLTAGVKRTASSADTSEGSSSSSSKGN